MEQVGIGASTSGEKRDAEAPNPKKKMRADRGGAYPRKEIAILSQGGDNHLKEKAGGG